MRPIKTGEVDLDEATARLRVRIPALRSIDRKRRAEEELTQAIAAELLAGLETKTSTIAA